MSIAVLDPQTAGRARARAQAAAIADAPRVVRRYTVNPRVALRPSPRRRSHASRRRFAPAATGPRVRHTRRILAAVMLLAQVGALAMLLTLPAFQVRTVTVSGNRLLSAGLLLRTAGVPKTSIFTVDADGVRARLQALPWVQTASVNTDLPGTVHISVVERSPVLRLRHGDDDLLLAADGATLPLTKDVAASLHVPVLIDDRVGSSGALDGGLLRTLGAVAAAFHAAIGSEVAAFQWGTDGVFAVWATSGWRAVLGHLDTDAAVAAVPAQMAALAALKSQLDFAHPTFGYVDLENLAGPAVGGTPGLSAEVQAALLPNDDAAATQPGGVAPPVRTPTPAPSATPSASVSPAPSGSPPAPTSPPA